MIADLIRRITAPAPTRLTSGDSRLALVALLVRIARSDGDYALSEIERIDRICEKRCGLSPAQARELRAQAEEVEADAPDTVRFTRAIKDAVPIEERIGVVEAMWEIVLIDGIRDAEEEAIVRLASHFLGVNDRDCALARQRVEARK